MHRRSLAFILAVLPILGAAVDIPPACAGHIARFLALIRAGDPQKAMTELWKDKLRWGGRDEMAKMVSMMKSMTEEVIGRYLGDELLYSEYLSKDYVTAVVMVKYERQPVFFRFAFYRPLDAFITDTFNMNTDVAEVRREWIHLPVLEHRPEAPRAAADTVP